MLSKPRGAKKIALNVAVWCVLGTLLAARALAQDGNANLARTFQNPNEQFAYQAVISCLQAGSSIDRCADNQATKHLTQDLRTKAEQCRQQRSSCQAAYDQCARNCPTTTAANDPAYDALIGCLQAHNVNCLSILKEYGLNGSSPIVIQALQDFNSGHIRESNSQPSQQCLDECAAACGGPCEDFDNQANQVDAAAQQAVEDWAKKNLPLQESGIAQDIKRLEQKVAQIAPAAMTDFDGQNRNPQDVLRGGLTDAAPTVKLNFPLKNIKAADTFEADIGGPQDTFPVEKIWLTPQADITDGSLVVSVAGGSKPMLLGEGAPGAPDYVRPDPLPAGYQAQEYVGIQASPYANYKFPPPASEQITFSEVIFSVFKPDPGFNDPEATIQMMHWNKQTKKWDVLPTEKYLCDYSTSFCRYAVKSNGNSLYAIAIKRSSSPTKYLFWILISAWLAGVVVLYRKFWAHEANRLKQSRSKNEQQKAIRAIGVVKYMLVPGALFFGNMMALAFTVASRVWLATTLPLNLTSFLLLYIINLGGGILFGFGVYYAQLLFPRYQKTKT